MLCFWASFHCSRWPRTCNNLDIWSHWPQVSKTKELDISTFLHKLETLMMTARISDKTHASEQSDQIGLFLKGLGHRYS